ncbi:MAG TPA: DUF1631 family protein [Burkholderiaceae bacterium]|jgi:hypothetical protein
MPIAPALLRFVDDELALAPALIERTLGGTMHLLRGSQDDPMAAAERANALGLVGALGTHVAAAERAFVEALREGVREALKDQHGHALDEFDAAGPSLELMDESRVEVDIEISRAIQLIDTTAEWELRELQTFTSTLVGQTHVSAESNPFRPQVYASALWQAACAVSPLPMHRTQLLRTASGVAAGLLKNAWAAASTRLESQGVQPGIYRSIVINAGTPTRQGVPLPSVDNPSTMAGLLSSMPGGSSAMQVSVANAAIPMGMLMGQASFSPVSPLLERALAQLDAMLLSPDTTPATFRAQRSALLDAAGSAPERQVVELVSRVFDAIAADPQLSPAHAALLARLRASALRVALRDPEMPATTRHVVWQFLDRVGELGAAEPKPGDPRATTLLSLCNALAQQLAGAAMPDAAGYRRALKQLDSLLATQLQSQLQAAQPAAQSLHEAEHRELLTQRLAQRLTEQMAPLRPSQSIRRFLTTTWSRVLAECIARDGEQADSTRACIKLVDDLLWSVQLPDHPKSRQRLIVLLPVILKRLRDGMALINVPVAEQERVFSELMTIHTEALRPSHRTEDRPLTPEEIVQRMREEVLPPSTGHGAFRDSLIDLGSMETVPAALLPNEPTPVEDSRRRVAALAIGSRLRLFIRGRWNRVQLLWRSEKGLFFLFAGEATARTHSISLGALERLAGAGLMRPLEERTLVQRALDTVMIDAGRRT